MPIAEFTSTDPKIHPNDLHPWGCPIYVLEKCLQDGSHLPSKWQHKSWLRVYVGHSSLHSGNVILVYNPLTRHTTPQFHVVFDDHFQTVHPSSTTQMPDEINTLLKELWANNQWQYTSDTTLEYYFDDNWDFPNLDDGIVDLSSQLLTHDPSTHNIFIPLTETLDSPNATHHATTPIPLITQTQESAPPNTITSPLTSPLTMHPTQTIPTINRNMAHLQSAPMTQVTPITQLTPLPKWQ